MWKYSLKTWPLVLIYRHIQAVPMPGGPPRFIDYSFADAGLFRGGGFDTFGAFDLTTLRAPKCPALNSLLPVCVGSVNEACWLRNFEPLWKTSPEFTYSGRNVQLHITLSYLDLASMHMTFRVCVHVELFVKVRVNSVLCRQAQTYNRTTVSE